MSPRGIDDYVQTQLASGGDLYTLHADALADLRPDLILTAGSAPCRPARSSRPWTTWTTWAVARRCSAWTRTPWRRSSTPS